MNIHKSKTKSKISWSKQIVPKLNYKHIRLLVRILKSHNAPWEITDDLDEFALWMKKWRSLLPKMAKACIRLDRIESVLFDENES